VEIDVAGPRGYLAARLRDVIQARWSADVRAIGVHGSLAHGDDTDGSDVNLLVVTYRNAGPRPAQRRVDGILVDLSVVGAEARLHAAMVTGLLSRTYFRSRADAVKRTGLAGADMRELAAVLTSQAEDLTARSTHSSRGA
jgi:predicted nucleotidyltransferase